jgi:hypothetical protein
MSIVVVTGGRNYRDRVTVYMALDRLHAQEEITLLVHGACEFGGADIIAEDWAKRRQIDYRGMPAKKTVSGRILGPERNRRMLKFASDEALAEGDTRPVRVCYFEGGRGTSDCCNAAVEIGLKLVDGEALARSK